MRKNFTSCASRLSKLMFLLVMVCAGVSAKAADPIDLGALEIGKTYTVPGKMVDVVATLTAPATGTLTVKYGGMRIYHDAAHNREIGEPQCRWSDYYTQGGIYEVDVTEGTTYYFFKGGINAWSDTPMTLFMDGYTAEMPLEFLTVHPEEGNVLTLTGDGSIYIKANQGVTAEAMGRLKYEGSSAAGLRIPNGVRAVDNEIFINPKSIIVSEIEKGNLKPGDEIKIGVKNIKTKGGNLHANADESGWLDFTFKCGSLPITCLTKKVPEVFKSYWSEGDPDGIIEFVFDGEVGVSDNTRVQLGYGNLEGEEGEYYSERLPVQVDGNKLICDLTGKMRTPVSMLPLFGTVYGAMSIQILGVVDKYGNPVASEGQGTIGSYSYSIPYEYVERANIVSEFTPANGSSLKDVNEIELWISGIDKFSFTGFNFSYEENGETKTVYVAKESANADITGNEATYLITIPAEVKGKSGVTVTLAGLETNDGYDHSDDVRAVYDAFVLTYCDPANGSKMEYLYDGETVTIKTNYSETYPEMYIVYEIEDMSPADPDQAIIKTESWLNRQADGSYVSEVAGNYKMVLGHQYKVTFTAWATEMDKNYQSEPIGSAYVIWEGQTAPFRYSDIKFESITPTPSESLILSKSDRTFTVKFDGLVRLDEENTFINMGMGFTTPFEAVTPVDPTFDENTGFDYANTWTLVVSESYMNSLNAPLSISFKAYDMNDLIIEGNNGTEEQTFFYFDYNTEGQFHDFEVFLMNEDYEPVDVPEALNTVFVFCEIGIDISYQYPLQDAVVMDLFGNEVAHVESIIKEEFEGGSDEVNSMLGLVLNKTITESGHYVMYFPPNYFSIGTLFDAYNSIEKVFDFEVGGSLTATVTPGEGVVTELKTFDIEFSIPVMPTEMTDNPYLALQDRSVIEITDIDLHLGKDEVWTSKMTLTLPETVTALGNYMLIIPAQYFYVQGTYLYTEEMDFSFSITGEAPDYGVTLNPAPGVVESLSKIEMVFDKYDEIGIGSGFPTLTIDGGEPIRLGDAELDWDIWNKCVIDLGETYTAAGTYVLNFPAGYFMLGSDGKESEEMTFTYTIGGGDTPQPADVVEFSPAPGEVESLSVINITFVNESAIGAGAGRATISYNGGEPTYLPDLDFDWDLPENVMIQNLGETYTAAGIYVITFPAGYFNLGEDGRSSEEIVITYTIAFDSVNGIEADFDGIYRVYNFSGVKMLETENAEELKTLAPGLYIINGKKILVK